MKKIGLIDSGIGGLTILKELIDQKVFADYFYISDRHNVPYGEKPQSFLLEKMIEMSHKLLDKNVDAIVIACNTATAETIDDLRKQFDIPFIGIEPYINYLNHSESDSKTALILTPATARSQRFLNLKNKYDADNLIDVVILKNLALIIEKTIHTDVDSLSAGIINEIRPLKDRGYKNLILGCTHYPIIKKFLEDYLDLKAIDPSLNVVKHLINYLKLEQVDKVCMKFQANFDNSGNWQEYNLKDFSFLNR